MGNTDVGESSDVLSAVREITRRLNGLDVAGSVGDLRARVRELAAIHHIAKGIWKGVLLSGGISGGGGQERLRRYLIAYVGTVLDGSELEVVAGISEYGRRIRELRVQEGYSIATGSSAPADELDEQEQPPLRPDQYLLRSLQPDAQAAARWKQANGLRRRKDLQARERMLELLKLNVGIPLSNEELRYVAGGASDFGRRLRELRTQEGWPIHTKNSGRADLPAGMYVLESSTPIAHAHDRKIVREVEAQVYKRDDNRCRLCGWRRADWREEDRRWLELHHLAHHVEGGANLATNLIVICNRCHDEHHAGRRSIDIGGA